MDLSADFNGISWDIHRDLMGFNGKLVGSIGIQLDLIS